MSSKIFELPTERAVAALSAAFLVDEEFQRTFWSEDRMDAPRARPFFRAQVSGSEAFRAPALGVGSESAPEGVITYHATHRGVAWNPMVTLRLLYVLSVYVRRIPSPVRSRVNHYSKWIYANVPKGPHFFITALGVPTAFRGRGHSAALIAEVVSRSQADGKSKGVGISTFTRTRADLYEKQGFRPTNHVSQDGLEAWVLFLDHGTSS